MALGIGIEVAQILGVPLPTSQGPVIVYSRDGQTPPSASQYGSRRHEAFMDFPWRPTCVNRVNAGFVESQYSDWWQDSLGRKLRDCPLKLETFYSKIFYY